MAAKCLLWAESGDVPVALVVVDVMAAADVVTADLTAVADTEAVSMTVVDAVTASQAQLPSNLRTALTKMTLIA